MRILLLNDRIPPESPGGAGQVVWRLAQGLRDAGHEVHLIAATEGEPFNEVRDGIPTYHLHSRYRPRFHAYYSLFNPQTLKHVRRLYEQIAPDVVNGHNIHAHLSYYTFTIAHRMGLPTVFNSHDVMPFAYNRLRHFVNPARCGVNSPEDYRLPRFYNLKQMRFRYNPLRNIIIRYILRHHVGVRVSVSVAHRQTLEANGLPPFQVVHNGIDVGRFQARAETVQALRARLGLVGRKVVMLAGRLSRDKGDRQLLAAMKQVIAVVPNALLLILSAREPNLGAEFEHLRDYVRSGGWLSGEELIAAFHAVDVVTSPSIIMDSFPTVNLEAMAAHKPVVATCYGGSSEAVVNGETGYIINPFDTEQFANRLIRLLTDDALRARMGQAGYERVQERFSLAKQVKQMVEIYETVMSTNRQS